jgi:hypothetical protein
VQKLLAVGVACDYVHFNAMSYSLKEVTKVRHRHRGSRGIVTQVFLGVAAVVSNCSVMGQAGSYS